MANFNKVVEDRDFGANLSRELARADLTLKPSEFLFIWAGSIVGVPVAMFIFSLRAARPRPARSPAGRPAHRLHGSRASGSAVARSAGSRAFNKQLAGHDHAHRQRAARRLFVPAGHRAGRARDRARRSRPSSAASSARSTSGLPFERRWPTWSGACRSDDLELMTTAISIQHQVGGNLAEILDSIAFTIRERVRIKGEIKTLTAQQRMSGYVVAGLPIGLAGFLFVAAPGFMDPMFAESARSPGASRRAWSSWASADS